MKGKVQTDQAGARLLSYAFLLPHPRFPLLTLKVHSMALKMDLRSLDSLSVPLDTGLISFPPFLLLSSGIGPLRWVTIVSQDFQSQDIFFNSPASYPIGFLL